MPKTRKTILVTGGLGFIGSRFIKYARDNTNWKIICLDAMTYAADLTRVSPEVLGKSLGNIIIGDICGNLSQHIDLDSVDYLVNFAAESHVDNSIKDGRPFLRSNVEGVLNLLETFRDRNLIKFVQISTDEVYGDMNDLRGEQDADETFKLRPSSYYSATKASADLLVQSASRTYGTPYLITRSCNNYGPRQHEEKFLPTIFKSIEKGTAIPLYGDGKQIREWMHVDDNVHAIFTLMISSRKNEVYNIGSGYHYTNIDIINKIAKIMKKEVKFEKVKDRLGHDRRYSLDCSKLHGYMPMSDVCTTLESFLGEECERINNRK